jgi:hypothetical protein
MGRDMLVDHGADGRQFPLSDTSALGYKCRVDSSFEASRYWPRFLRASLAWSFALRSLGGIGGFVAVGFGNGHHGVVERSAEVRSASQASTAGKIRYSGGKSVFG